MNNEYWEILKNEADKVKEDSLYLLMESDTAYKTACARLRKAEAKYAKARETLSPRQRKVIENLLSSIDNRVMETETLNYMAGVRDGISLMLHFSE